MDTQTPETFKPCDPQDLTAMPIEGIIDFAIKALEDAPVGCFVEGTWMENSDAALHDQGWARVFDVRPLPGEAVDTLDYYATDARDRASFKEGIKDPERARYCAVGAVLAADGARAAFDWITVGDTARWQAGEDARVLLNSLSNVFETKKIRAMVNYRDDDKSRATVARCMKIKIGICIAFLQRLRARMQDERAAFRSFLYDEVQTAREAMYAALDPEDPRFP